MLTFVRREFYRSLINFPVLFPVGFAHAFVIVDGLDQIPKIENEGQARTCRDIETRLNSDWRAKGKDAFVEFTRSRVGILANAYGKTLRKTTTWMTEATDACFKAKRLRDQALRLVRSEGRASGNIEVSGQQRRIVE